MPTDVSPDFLTGLFLPDYDADAGAIWDAETTITADGPIVGRAIPAGDGYRAALEASGTQESGTSYQVRIQAPGFPAPDEATSLWKNSADADTDWRGWDPPHVPSGWDRLVTSAIATTAHPHAITLDDGTLLVAYRSTVGGEDKVRVAYKSAIATSWSFATVWDSEAALSYELYPCLVALPDGTVMLLHWYVDTTNNRAQVRRWIADDADLSSWTSAGVATLGPDGSGLTGIDVSETFGAGKPGFDLRRLRAAYNGDQVLLLAHLVYHANDNTGSGDPAYADVLAQYASDSLGGRFSLVDLWDGSVDEAGGYPDVVARDGMFVTAYVRGSDSAPQVVPIASAWDKLAGATSYTPSGSYEVWAASTTALGQKTFDDADLALWLADDGTLYLSGRQPLLQHQAIILRSTTGGISWDLLGKDAGIPSASSAWCAMDSGTYPVNFCGTYQGSRGVIFTNWSTTPGTFDNSLDVVFLGGSTQVPFPGVELFPAEDKRGGYKMTWLPIEEPSNVGWVKTGAGTFTITADGGRFATSSNTLYYTYGSLSGTVEEGLIVRAAVQVASGASLGSDTCALRLINADGADKWDVSIRAALIGGVHQLRVYDNNATAQLGDDLNLATANAIDIKVALAKVDSAGAVQVWARERAQLGDRAWPLVAGLAAPSDVGTGSIEVRMGVQVSATVDATWMACHVSHDEATGLQLAGGLVNPTDLLGRPLSSRPVWVDGGVRVACTDGPAETGQTWTIAADALYPTRHLLPAVAPSPRRIHRAVDNSAITLSLRRGGSLPGLHPIQDTLGVLILGANWRTGSVWGDRDGAPTWEKIGDIDLAKGLTGLPFQRVGDLVYVDTAVANTPTEWIRWAAFEGCTISLGGTLRQIRLNTDGAWWGSGTHGLRPMFRLGEDYDDTEPASGTCQIWRRNALFYAHAPRPSTGSARYEALQIRIDGLATRGGKTETGLLVPGTVAVFPRTYALGRVVARQENTQLTELDDWTTRARNRGPGRDVLEFTFADGLWTAPLHETNPDPDYILGTPSSGALALGARAGSYDRVMGLVRQVRGPYRTVAAFERMERGPPDVGLITDGLFYGRLGGIETRQTTDYGDEQDTANGEIVRLATLSVIGEAA